MFEDGDVEKPIVMGQMMRWEEGAVTQHEAMPVPEGSPPNSNVIVEADGQKTMYRATKELTIRCGESSITLTESGKIILRGKYILSRAEGVNRIKGGSVQIN